MFPEMFFELEFVALVWFGIGIAIPVLVRYCHTRPYLEISAKLKIYQVSSLQDGATKWHYYWTNPPPADRPTDQC
jgi:hypothetical protein